MFAAYQESIPAVKEVIAGECPPQPGESEARWERRMRSAYVDVCRFYLPAGSLANVGMTINARALEHAISKMLSHPLEEVRQLGAEIKQAAQAEVPTLVKYANAQSGLERAGRELSAIAAQEPAAQVADDWCKLVAFNEDGEERVLAAALYRFGKLGYAQSMEQAQRMSLEQRRELAEAVLGSLDEHEIPMRELEYATYTFDLTLDQGAYFELKRHRMMTQTPQRLTALLGYALPRRICAAGLEEHFRRAMELARSAYEQLAAFNPDVASYVVPNAFNRRVLLSLNLRSAVHLLRLRAAENAHFSMRRAAYRMAEQIQSATPLLGSYLRLPEGDTWQSISADHFTSV